MSFCNVGVKENSGVGSSNMLSPQSSGLNPQSSALNPQSSARITIAKGGESKELKIVDGS